MFEQPFTTLDELLQSKRYEQTFKEIVDSSFSRPTSFSIWVGAGFSAYFAKFPTWDKFLSEVAESIEDETDRGVAKVLIERKKYQIAAEFITSIVPSVVDKLIQKAFSNLSNCPSLEDLIVGDLCASTMITTNYDSLLERAYPHYKITSPVVDPYLLFTKNPKLLKLHGSVGDSKNCVLSVSQYAKTYNRDLDYLLINLLTSQNIFFVGTSLDSGEPYFRHMAHIHSNALSTSKRWAILSTNSREKETITKRCKDFESKYGIKVVPYIPNGSDHSCFIEILKHLRDKQPSRAALSDHLIFIRAQIEKFSTNIMGAENLLPLFKRLVELCTRTETSVPQKLEIIEAFEKYTNVVFVGSECRPQHIIDQASNIYHVANDILKIPFDSIYLKFKEVISALQPSDGLEKSLTGIIRSAKMLCAIRKDNYGIVHSLGEVKAIMLNHLKPRLKID